jgi:O-antigen/teichoic acid export membrane protein
VTSGPLKVLADLISDLFRAETTTMAGRINALGMLLSIVVITALSLTPPIEALVRIVRPEARLPGVPLVQLFILFWIAVFICALMVHYLERHKS